MPTSVLGQPSHDRAPDSTGWRLEHTYAELPALFHADAVPTPVREPEVVVLNSLLAESMGLDAEAFGDDRGTAIFSGNALPPGAPDCSAS